MELGRLEGVGLPEPAPETLALMRRPSLMPRTVMRATRPPQEGRLVSRAAVAVPMPRRAPRAAADTVLDQRSSGSGGRRRPGLGGRRGSGTRAGGRSPTGRCWRCARPTTTSRRPARAGCRSGPSATRCRARPPPTVPRSGPAPWRTRRSAGHGRWRTGRSCSRPSCSGLSAGRGSGPRTGRSCGRRSPAPAGPRWRTTPAPRPAAAAGVMVGLQQAHPDLPGQRRPPARAPP